MDAKDIRDGSNRLRLQTGEVSITRECNYIGLQLSGEAKPMAWYGDEVVGMQTSNRRFTWITLPLWDAFDGPARDEVLVPLIRSMGVEAPVKTEGDRIIVQLARSQTRGQADVFVQSGAPGLPKLQSSRSGLSQERET